MLTGNIISSLRDLNAAGNRLFYQYPVPKGLSCQIIRSDKLHPGREHIPITLLLSR
jgi:hypothetical protein